MKNTTEIITIDEKTEISYWIETVIDDPLELFSSDHFDDTILVDEETHMIETYKTSIEELEIQAELTYYFEDYLRNNLTQFNRYNGSLHLNIKVFYTINSAEYVIYEVKEEVGTFSHSEDAEEYGDPPDLHLCSIFDNMIRQIENKVSSLPDTLRFRIDPKISAQMKKINKNIQELQEDRDQLKIKIKDIDDAILKEESQLEVLQKNILSVVED